MIISKGKCLLIALVIGQNFSTVAGAREFARKVLCSKAALAAVGVGACGNAALFYRKEKAIPAVLESLPAASINWVTKQKIRQLCERHGYNDISIVDNSKADVLAQRSVIRVSGKKIFIGINDIMARVFNGESLRYVPSEDESGNFLSFFITQEHIFTSIEGLLLAQPNFEKCAVLSTGNLPVSILAAKAARVAGRGRIFAVCAGLSSWALGALGSFALARNCFYDADNRLAKDTDTARVVAQSAALTSLAVDEKFRLLLPIPRFQERNAALEEQWGKLGFARK